MVLIGQYDSPFVRRVAIALHLHGFTFEHRPWSVFGDADKVAACNPMMRVPALVLDDGETLLDSWAIVDSLDGLAGPEQTLFPRETASRRAAMRICALAVGTAEKAVSMVYEQRLHERATPGWMARCAGQIAAVTTELDADLHGRGTPYWFGDRIGNADVAVACLMRFVGEAHPGLLDPAAAPTLAAHAARCEALTAFQSCQQPFAYTPPKAE